MNIDVRNRLLVLVLGACLFIPFLGRVHLFDWDEINFAEAGREMMVSGNYLQVQIDYKPFWEKPPLFSGSRLCPCMRSALMNSAPAW